jgi:hypothetical protein
MGKSRLAPTLAQKNHEMLLSLGFDSAKGSLNRYFESVLLDKPFLTKGLQTLLHLIDKQDIFIIIRRNHFLRCSVGCENLLKPKNRGTQ